MPAATSSHDGVSRLRVRIFVDFWNFSLSLRNEDDDFRVDWKPIGPLLTADAGKLVDATANALFEGMHVYSSIDPKKAQDVKLKSWLTNSLDKMPGTHVVVLERQKKRSFPKCPTCQGEIAKCTSNPTSSDRRNAPAKPSKSSARSRRPLGPAGPKGPWRGRYRRWRGFYGLERHQWCGECREGWRTRSELGGGSRSASR
jgi:ribosomal protein L34E